MERDPAIILDVEAIKIPGKILRIFVFRFDLATSAGTGLRYRSRRAHLARIDIGLLFGQGIF